MINADSDSFAGALAPGNATVRAAIDPNLERGGPSPNTHPSFTATQAGQQLTRGGYSLNGSAVTGTAAVVTYAFRVSADVMPQDATGFSQFSANQIAATQLVLQAWSDVANVTFNRVDDGAGYSNDATLLFGNYNAGVDGAAAFSYMPTDAANGSSSSDVWINNSYAYEANPTLLNYGMQTLAHEIGHAIGLEHPGDYDATAGAPSYGTDAGYFEDSRQYTVMSYFSETNTGGDFNGYYASAPLMDDIAAAQRLYGANMTTRSTNTTYGFHSTAGRAQFSATDANSILIFCVWDAGGSDVFDFSGYAQDSLIDLRAGHFSSVGGLIGNVSIAQGVTIEHALAGTGNDFLIGNEVANILQGGSGNDRLMGGAGNDTLNGSSGFDIADYSLDTAAVTVVLGIDTVSGGGTGTSSGVTAGADSLINVEGLIGGQGNDSFTGNTFGNLLDGGAGTDVLTGGTGDDTYGIDSLSDTINELAGEGTDTVAASISYVLSNANLENLTLTGIGDINGTGNAGINFVTGNAGNNRLDGGTAADTLVGGAGNDTFVVDDIGDGVIERFNEGLDAVEASVTWSLGANIETLTLVGAAAINGTGNGFDNAITGNGAANSLSGAAGNDTLDGGLGNDTLAGGIGDDLYFVESGDVIVEDVDEGTDTVSSSRSFALAVNFENLILTGTGGIGGAGNNGANWITGNSGANTLSGIAGNDVLDGGLGNDTMDGGTGNDTFYVDSAGDAVIEANGGGTDTVFSQVTYSLAGGFVENLNLTGAGDLSGTGNGQDNRLTGNDGNNSLVGADGNDMLDGGLGADTMDGGLGDDVFMVDSASDVIVELAGQGTDTVVSALAYDLTGREIENLALTGDSHINATGNAFNNVLTGNSGNNTLLGAGGDDTLYGGETISGDIVDDGSVLHDTRATATYIKPGMFNILDNPFIIDPTVIPHATILATGNDTYRWYSFTIRAGATATFDIDATIAIDTQLRLYDNKGKLLEMADDSWDQQGAGGSTTSFDSYLEYTFAQSGTYFIEVSEYGHGVVTTGESYQLNISLDRNGTMWGNDILDGGAGADSMAGGYGNDTYVVDNIADKVTEAFNSGSDLVYSTVSYTLSDNIERLILNGVGNLNGTGSAQGNQITGNDGNNRIDGAGGSDIMVGGKGDDTYIVDTTGDIVTELANEGIDLVLASATFNGASGFIENMTATGTGNVGLTGNTLDNILLGNSGNNVLKGGQGNDSLTGADGDDSLEGGAGNDTLNGGLGNDTYIIDQFDVLVDTGGVDTIVSARNYVLGDGYENLTLSGGSNLAATGNGVANIITGNNGANSLDGAGGVDTLAGGQGDDSYYIDSLSEVINEARDEGIDTVFAGFSYTLSPTQYVDNLTLTGTGAFNATGNGLANFLRGNGAANRLDGGTGADSLSGGAGNDTYVVDNAGDLVAEVGGGVDTGGDDTVMSSVKYTLGLYVERLILTGAGHIAGTGNALNNTLVGNAGNNLLDGGAGDDTMAGALGNDSYLVDSAGDVVREYVDQGIDTVTASLSYDMSALYVENLILSGAADLNGTGNALVNIITGNSGNNVLDGGKGVDTLYGGAGNDTYYVDNTADRAIETTTGGADSGGADIVYSLATFTLGSFIENLVLTGTFNVSGTGNTLNNVLTGNSGNNVLAGLAGNDVLDGATGADQMAGGLGDDTFYVDNAGDRVIELSGGGTDTVFSSITFNAGGQYIEVISLTGTDAINSTGNAIANTLLGNDGNNILDGGSGNDTLNGGGGNDTLIGGQGSDLFVFGLNSGADTISGFAGAVDSIDLHLISNGVANGGGITLSQSGANTLIDLGGGNMITLLNTTATDPNLLNHIIW